MAENMMGMESSNCGDCLVQMDPSGFRSSSTVFLPKNTFVSIGSRRGSMDGFVTCEAFIKILSQ